MKVLLDTCVWGGTRDALNADGHEVEWTGDWSIDPGDEQILKHASTNKQILVTLDKDFGELAVVQGFEHSGIIRLVAISATLQGPSTAATIRQYGRELSKGAIVTVEPGRTRVRPGLQE